MCFLLSFALGGFLAFFGEELVLVLFVAEVPLFFAFALFFVVVEALLLDSGFSPEVVEAVLLAGFLFVVFEAVGRRGLGDPERVSGSYSFSALALLFSLRRCNTSRSNCFAIRYSSNAFCSAISIFRSNSSMLV